MKETKDQVMSELGINQKQIKESFDKYLEQPMVKVILSSTKPTDPPELLMSLLESLFTAGVGYGSVTVLTGIMKKHFN